MVDVLKTLFLVEMIKHDYFIFFIAVLEKLWDHLILLDLGAREAEGLTDMILLEFFGLSKIQQQEISFDSYWQLLCLDCYMGES